MRECVCMCLCACVREQKRRVAATTGKRERGRDMSVCTSVAAQLRCCCECSKREREVASRTLIPEDDRKEVIISILAIKGRRHSPLIASGRLDETARARTCRLPLTREEQIVRMIVLPSIRHTLSRSFFIDGRSPCDGMSAHKLLADGSRCELPCTVCLQAISLALASRLVFLCCRNISPFNEKQNSNQTLPGEPRVK